MADSHKDTPELRGWLASQLNIEDVPEVIWDTLVEEKYVKDAQNSDFPNSRQDLLIEARKQLKIYRAGSGSPKVSKKQPTGKRQRATDISRAEVEAEIAAKIDQAKAMRSEQFASSSNGREHRGPIEGIISDNRITVTAEPWVSPEEVCKQYESLRNIWFWTPTPSERRIQLLRFVIEFCEGYHDEERGISGLARTTSFRKMMERWNRRYPQGHEWHYKDVRNFRRDTSETFETLTRFKDF